MKFLYGTSNPAKLSAMKKRLESLNCKYGIELIGLKDLNIKIPPVPENGNTPLENAHIIKLFIYQYFLVILAYILIMYWNKISQEFMCGQ